MKIQIEIPDSLGKELKIISQRVGFATPEQLMRNYVREVILAARTDAAANMAKQQAVEASTDLDVLTESAKSD